MKMQSEKRGEQSKWSFETTDAIDRAVAALIIVAAAMLAHLLGLDADVAHLFALFF